MYYLYINIIIILIAAAAAAATTMQSKTKYCTHNFSQEAILSPLPTMACLCIWNKSTCIYFWNNFCSISAECHSLSFPQSELFQLRKLKKIKEIYIYIIEAMKQNHSEHLASQRWFTHTYTHAHKRVLICAKIYIHSFMQMNKLIYYFWMYFFWLSVRPIFCFYRKWRAAPTKTKIFRRIRRKLWDVWFCGCFIIL